MAKHKTVQVQMTIGEMLESGASDLSNLREEMESWRDGMEEKLSATQKYEDVSAAAEALSGTDGLEDTASNIADQLTLLAEGREEVKPCSVHQMGSACDVCGWNGVGQLNPNARVRIEEKVHTLGSDPGLMFVGRIARDGTCYCFPNPERKRARTDSAGLAIYPTEEEARNALLVARAQLIAKYPPVMPPLRKAVTPLAPLDGAAELVARQFKITTLQAYKGKALSRTTRCNEAVSMAREGISQLEAWLDEQDGGAGGIEEQGLDEEHQGAIEEIRSAIEEYNGVLDEAEGVEFPGMY